MPGLRGLYASAQLALGALLLAVSVNAQTPPQPPESKVVSDSSSSQPEGIAIEPVKRADASPDAAITVDPASLLPDLPPVPRKDATLIGGTITHLDRVRDRLTLTLFGGGHATAMFDPRTQIYIGAKPATLADLREGERAYLDTILDGSTIFARAIRLKMTTTEGDTRGILVKYRAGNVDFSVRDGISPNLVNMRLNSSTQVKKQGRIVSANVLTVGSLIAVTFKPDGSGHSLASEIEILALPGTTFTFVGRVTHLDLRTGLLVLESSTDHKIYELFLAQSVVPDDSLHVGSNVTVKANFEDARYVAHSIGFTP